MTHNHIVSLGELLLRLKPPQHERLFQSAQMEATFGGAEVNVAVSLATFGLDVAFVTALPSNAVGSASCHYLQRFGVDHTHVVRQGERLGLYYLEVGSSQRPSRVVYDRAYSSIATAAPSDFDWEAIFQHATWFHVTGITPALSQSAADLTLHALSEAQKRGVTISCDNNFRAKLWQYGKTAAEVMPELVKFVDVVIANEEDCRLSLGVDVENQGQASDSEHDRYQRLGEKMFATFPNLKYQAMTLRRSVSASHHSWGACLYNGRELYLSRRYDIDNIVDRVGTGDAFAAGLIYGLATEMADEQALEFAVAASCLKHTIHGDANLVTAAEVHELMAGDGSGRVQR